MFATAEDDVCALFAALALPEERESARRQLGARVGAATLVLLFAENSRAGPWRPLDELPADLRGSPGLSALLEAARVEGIHRASLPVDEAHAPEPLLVRSYPGLALLFVGGVPEAACLERLPSTGALLGDLLRAEARERVALETAERATKAAAASAADIERAAHRMAQLQEATARLAMALSSRDVAEVLLSICESELDSCAGVVYFEDDEGHMRLRAHRGFAQEPQGLQVLHPDTPLPLAVAIRERRALWIESHEALLADFPMVAGSPVPGARLQTVIAVPLVHGGRVIGGLALSFASARRFEPDLRRWVEAIAGQCAVAAERARLYDGERAARSEAETLFRLADELNRPQLDVDALVQRVTDEARALTGAAFGAFFYNVGNPQDPSARGSYQLYALSGAPREAFAHLEMPRNTALFDVTFSGRGVLRLDDVRKDSRYGKSGPHHGLPAGHLPVVSYLAAPVVTNDGDVIGGIFLGHPQAARFTEQHERMVKALVAAAAVATARKRAEATLRARELELRTIADALPTLVTLSGADGRYRFANAAHARWFGLDPAELRGKHAREVLGQAAFSALESGFDRVLCGEEVSVSTWLESGRERRAVDVRIVPVREQGERVTGWVTLLSDVTERVRTEAKQRVLARAASILLDLGDARSTLQQLADLVVPDLADWCVLHVEGEGESIRVLAHADPERARWAQELDHRFPPRPEDVRGTMAVMRTGKPELVAQIDDAMLVQAAKSAEHLEMLRGAGMRSYLCVPLRARKGTVGALAFVSSTADRVFDEADLSLAQDLADRAALCIENARLSREAQAGNRAKDEFLAMLGHELRNPLAPILTALQLMKERSGEVFARERAIIERQVQHLIRLVDDLLDVSRITRGKVELRRRTLGLRAVVTRSVEACAPLLEERKHHLEVRVPDELLVEGDEDRLVQVVSNLLTNAAKYTPRAGRIDVLAEVQGPWAVLRVRDDGVGVAPELLPTLFDSFVQGESTIDRAKGGLGLGLTIVRSLVAMHGGSVEAHSDGPGRGSEFVVRLPRVLAASTDTKGRDRRPTPLELGGSELRVLIVDDNRDAAELLAEALADFGHEVKVAFDGPSALELARELRPQIAFLDLGLPVMDGLELAGRLRSQPGLDHVKLVAVTGYGQPKDRERTRRAGFDEHMVKPVSLEHIQRTLGKLGARFY